MALIRTSHAPSGSYIYALGDNNSGVISNSNSVSFELTAGIIFGTCNVKDFSSLNITGSSFTAGDKLRLINANGTVSTIDLTSANFPINVSSADVGVFYIQDYGTYNFSLS